MRGVYKDRFTNGEYRVEGDAVVLYLNVDTVLDKMRTGNGILVDSSGNRVVRE